MFEKVFVIPARCQGKTDDLLRHFDQVEIGNFQTPSFVSTRDVVYVSISTRAREGRQSILTF